MYSFFRSCGIVGSSLIAWMLGVSSPAARAADIYQGAGVVHLDRLGIGSATYLNVSLAVNLPLVSGPTGSVAVGTRATYDPANSQLNLPQILVGSTLYFNVVATVNHLISLGSVSGADTFDGTNLQVSNFGTPGPPAHNLTVHVGLSNVVRVGGGLPAAAADQYDPATGLVTLAAVQVGSRAYTNVALRVKLSDVLSIAGFTESNLYVFKGGADGAGPEGALAMDAAGNLYGTTCNLADSTYYGTVFKLAPDGSGGYTKTTLHVFTSATDGLNPCSNLVIDASGNLYGSTGGGGTAGGGGTLFELAADGKGGYTENSLYSFPLSAGGATVGTGDITVAADGTLYGTTQAGAGSPGVGTNGTVFKLSGSTLTTLHVFQTAEILVPGPSQIGIGDKPLGPLAIDAQGNLYGALAVDGTQAILDAVHLAPGSIWRLTPAGGYSVVYYFQGGTDGVTPNGGLVLDAHGNLYGTTYAGGSANMGTVFKIAPDGTGGYAETVLFSFRGGSSDGANPNGGLIMDAGGVLYGTTYNGGSGGLGTAFALYPNGQGGYTESILHNFRLGAGGAGNPHAGLLLDDSGALYGTVEIGSTATTTGPGAVFRIQ